MSFKMYCAIFCPNLLQGQFPTKLLPIQRKCFINVTKITSTITLKPTLIVNFTFISSQWSMLVGSMQLKYIFGLHTVDPHSSLHTVVQKSDWTSIIFHIISDCLLYETDLQPILVPPRCYLLQYPQGCSNASSYLVYIVRCFLILCITNDYLWCTYLHRKLFN